MPGSRPIILEEGQYSEITIDKTKPQTIYMALPLLSCFGILFQWEDKAILYHAPSGVPNEDLLKKFSESVSRAKYDPEKVEITIACSDTEVKATLTLDACVKKLSNAHFSKKPIIKEKLNCYSIDSWGNHGEIIVKKVVKEENPSPQSIRKNSR